MLRVREQVEVNYAALGTPARVPSSFGAVKVLHLSSDRVARRRPSYQMEAAWLKLLKPVPTSMRRPFSLVESWEAGCAEIEGFDFGRGQGSRAGGCFRSRVAAEGFSMAIKVCALMRYRTCWKVREEEEAEGMTRLTEEGIAANEPSRDSLLPAQHLVHYAVYSYSFA